MEINNRTVGLALIVFSVILFGILFGIKLDADKQATYLCDNFHLIQNQAGACPAHTSNISWLLLVALGVDVAIFLSGFYFAFLASKLIDRNGNAMQVAALSKDFDESQLSEEEKMVYHAVLDKGGSAFQGDLIRDSGFSKVKVSRILDRLEAAGAVERKRRGMANLVVQK